jgi:hypothetical protein
MFLPALCSLLQHHSLGWTTPDLDSDPASPSFPMRAQFLLFVRTNESVGRVKAREGLVKARAGLVKASDAGGNARFEIPACTGRVRLGSQL